MDFASGVGLLLIVSMLTIVVCYLVWHKRYVDTIITIKTLSNQTQPMKQLLEELEKQVRWFGYLGFLAGCTTFPLTICWVYLSIEFITKP